MEANFFFSLLNFAERRKSSIGGETTLSRHSHKSQKSNKSGFGRKLETDFNKGPNGDRRRLKSNDKIFSSSSSCSESENDTEIEVVLNKSRRHLSNTEALTIRSHLLRPEDFVSVNGNWLWSWTPSATFIVINCFFLFVMLFQDEITATCRENVRCLETILMNKAGSVLSHRRHDEIRGESVYLHSSTDCECHCNRIANYFSFMVDYVSDWTNMVNNWTLYKLFIKMLRIIFAPLILSCRILHFCKCTLLPVNNQKKIN